MDEQSWRRMRKKDREKRKKRGGEEGEKTCIRGEGGQRKYLGRRTREE